MGPTWARRVIPGPIKGPLSLPQLLRPQNQRVQNIRIRQPVPTILPRTIVLTLQPRPGTIIETPRKHAYRRMQNQDSQSPKTSCVTPGSIYLRQPPPAPEQRVGDEGQRVLANIGQEECPAIQRVSSASPTMLANNSTSKRVLQAKARTH
jgi:hypothetical protein